MPEGDIVGYLLDDIVEWKAERYNDPSMIIMSKPLYMELLSVPQMAPSYAKPAYLFGIQIVISSLIRNRGYILR